MTDVYIYHFFVPNDSDNGAVLSRRPATLEAIKGRGVVLMDTQLVVDHTELDQEGFLVSRACTESIAADQIAAQLSSLEARASSRDTEANASDDGVEQYMLRLESRELRKQAINLKESYWLTAGVACSSAAPIDSLPMENLATP
jgi:hypothetical protein